MSLCEQFGIGPAALTPLVGAEVRYASLLTDIKHETPRSAVFHINVVGHILALLRFRSPRHITGNVSKIVLDPFYRMLRSRAWSDVTKKRGEIVNPSLVDGYSSAAVSIIMVFGWVGAALNHPAPDAVFWRITKAVLQSFCFRHTESSNDSCVAWLEPFIAVGPQLI